MFNLRQSCLLLFICHNLLALCTTESKQFANTWVVQLHEHMSVEEVNKIARDLGFENLGKIFDDDKLYSFKHPRVAKRSVNLAKEHHASLMSHVKIRSAEQEVILKRVKRDYQVEPQHPLNDASWTKMWYLNRAMGKTAAACGSNPAAACFDMNVIPAWNKGHTGKGVSVTILDDGIEHSHPDLHENYDPYASYDINANDPDPAPRYDYTNENRHGTRCAGEVAAVANNGNCAVGVAYNAKIGGIRMLDGDVTDSVEARSLKHNRTHVDIYSASWGPDDNGRTVDGPGKLAKVSFSEGVKYGRNGKGNIFLWASGNGGNYQDSCACDGYCNSIYTLSVSSAQEDNQQPWYLEECASTLGTTYSSGVNYGMKKIITTDLHHLCTEGHTGTSASAPLAAGLVAQMLSANPDLRWRDVQYIVMMTSRPEPLLKSGEFQTNGVGKKYSHRFGYGLMDAAAMCDMAANWKIVPAEAIQFSTPIKSNVRRFPDVHTESIRITGCSASSADCTNIRYLEHVQLELTVGASHRGNLMVELTSPSGTKSTVLPYRRSDTTSAQFPAWPFLSVHYWGENPVGEWQFTIYNGKDRHVGEGVLSHSRLILHGLVSDPTRKTRINCHELCDSSLGCIGEGADQCIQCNSIALLILESRTCVKSCPPTFYKTELRMCEKCPASCQRCDSSMECTKCNENYYLNTDYLCVDQCPDGLFAHRDLHQCMPCNETCARCIDEKTCAECKLGWDLVDSECKAPCKPDEYHSGASGTCTKCSADIDNCQRCAMEDSDTVVCHLCQEGYLLYKDKCTSECPSNTFPNVSSCDICHESCTTCYEGHENNCLSCKDSQKLTLENRCVDGNCTKTEFMRPDGECDNCHPSCSECTGPDVFDCNRCSSGRYLKDGMCVEKCGGGFYPSNVSQTCELCHPSCLTCTDKYPDSCILCDLYHEHIDIHIHNPTGLQTRNCSTNCSEGEYLYVCDKSFNKTFCHESVSTCKNCSQSCLTCVGMKNTDCTSCNSTSFLTAEGRCVSECPDGTYQFKNFPQPSICKRCHLECETCSGPGENQCKTCMEGRTLALKTENGQNEVVGTCVTLEVLRMSCFRNQYFNITSLRCRRCADTCESCFGPSIAQCLTCGADRKLDAGQCVKCCDTNVLKPTEFCTICTDEGASNGVKEEHERLKNKLILILTIVVLTLLSLFIVIFAVLQYCVTGRCWKSDKALTLTDSYPAGHIKYSELKDQDQEDILYSADDGLVKSQNGYTSSSRWRNSTFDSD